MRLYKNKKILGFSLAEAMITLLIISVAISAMAPLFTRRNQMSNQGGSKWMFTRTASNITRQQGKVGIGVLANNDPQAMLDIRSDSEDFITIRKDGRNIFTIDNAGRMVINIPGGLVSRAMSVQQDGTETAFVDSNGTAKFSRANVFRENGEALQLGTSEGQINVWINADGTLTTNNPAVGSRDALRMNIQRQGNSVFRVFNDGTARASRFITTRIPDDGWITATSIRDIIDDNEVVKYWEKYNGTTSWNPTYTSIMMFRGACPADNSDAFFNDRWTSIGTGEINGIAVSYCQKTEKTN